MSAKLCAEELKNEEFYLRKESDNNYHVRDCLFNILIEIRKCFDVTAKSHNTELNEVGDIPMDFQNKVILALAKTVEIEARLDSELEENLNAQEKLKD